MTTKITKQNTQLTKDQINKALKYAGFDNKEAKGISQERQPFQTYISFKYPLGADGELLPAAVVVKHKKTSITG